MRRTRLKSLSTGALALCGLSGLGVPATLAQTARPAPGAYYYYPAPASVPAPAAATPGYYYYPAPTNASPPPGYYYFYAAPANSNPPSGFYYTSAYPPSANGNRASGSDASANPAPASGPPRRPLNFLKGGPRRPATSTAEEEYAYKS